MNQANFDLVILQETKIIDRVYMGYSARFIIVASDMPSSHCGGVVLLYKESPRFAVESHQQNRTNIASF